MKVVDPYRKKPGQVRSEATVQAIFEATARILQTDGVIGLNTNAIAKLAGVSIGTLYQYFPDKKAILIALARRELEATTQAVIIGVTGAGTGVIPADPVRAAVQALLNGFSGRQRTRKVLIEALVANGLAEELALPADRVVEVIMSHQAQEQTNDAAPMTPLSLYVLTRALLGIIRAAVMEQSPYLKQREFEDELVKLIQKFLKPLNRAHQSCRPYDVLP